jgi:tRNA(Ile)-lysidine synthase
VVRPLLFLKKQEIEDYAALNNLPFRTDSSNASDKYVRNNIRHHLIPFLKTMNAEVEDAIDKTMQHLQGVESIYNNAIETQRKNIVIVKNGITYIDIDLLKKTESVTTYLYEFLKPYNFTSGQVADIGNALAGASGKQFSSSTHVLLKDRQNLIITPIVDVSLPDNLLVREQDDVIIAGNGKLSFSRKSTTSDLATSNTIAHLDFDKLTFPLTLRRWQHGDVFYPFGLKGKKKLSDFFIDKKLTLLEKEQVYLLCSDTKIVWVIGHRIDNRFRLDEHTKNVYVVKCEPLAS